MKGNIDKLIAVILNGTATDAEQKVFNEWLQKNEQNQKVFENIKNYLKTRGSKIEVVNRDGVKNKIWAKAHQIKHTKSRGIHSSIYRAAAAIALLLTFAFLIKEFSSRPVKHTCVAKLKTIEKKNPAGIKSKVLLPDGSIVYLNSESSIKFTEGFQDSIRWVEMTGEAFFEVHKNLQKPFVVKAGGIMTQALGTSFNINAYMDNGAVDVSLFTGKVKVRSVNDENPAHDMLLEPGRHVVFKNNGAVKNGKFDQAKVVGWKEGIMVFDNADYYSVVKKLERWYGVKIINEGNRPDWNLNATFDNASLEHALDVLSHSEQFEYKLFEDTVKIKPK